MESRIREVMSDVLGVPKEDLNDASSTTTMENWDSLNHMKLVVALEEEFGIQFTDEEILQMQDVLSIKKVIAKYKNVRT